MDCNFANDATIIKILGKGAFGEVMLVDVEGEELVAKTLHRANKSSLRQFDIERRVLEKLANECQDTSVVCYRGHCIDPDSDRYTIFMTYIPNATDLLEIGGKLNNIRDSYAADIVRTWIAKRLMEIMMVFNDMGIIHKDIKPENIIARGDVFDEIVANYRRMTSSEILELLGGSQLTLIDFGMSCLLDEPSRCYTIGGTASYMLPELVNDTLVLSLVSSHSGLEMQSVESLFLDNPKSFRRLFRKAINDGGFGLDVLRRLDEWSMAATIYYILAGQKYTTTLAEYHNYKYEPDSETNIEYMTNLHDMARQVDRTPIKGDIWYMRDLLHPDPDKRSTLAETLPIVEDDIKKRVHEYDNPIDRTVCMYRDMTIKLSDIIRTVPGMDRTSDQKKFIKLSSNKNMRENWCTSMVGNINYYGGCTGQDGSVYTLYDIWSLKNAIEISFGVSMDVERICDVISNGSDDEIIGRMNDVDIANMMVPGIGNISKIGLHELYLMIMGDENMTDLDYLLDDVIDKSGGDGDAVEDNVVELQQYIGNVDLFGAIESLEQEQLSQWIERFMV